MKTWTSKERYAPYASYSPAELECLQKRQAGSIWHLNYHIQPQSGLLNDPNGFAYFNQRWYLAYQNFPFGAVHGLKSWHYLSSPDLVHWREEDLFLEPQSPYSTHGVYSGSALPIDDQLFLMYTGNVRTPDGGRISTQVGNWLDQDQHLGTQEIPLIKQPAGYTANFRDPQILFVDGQYYALIGAQTQSQKGAILLYQAAKPTGPWNLIGPLDLGEDLGFMIECPNLAFVDGQVALIFCPQGLDRTQVPYANIYPNMYLLADGIDWQQAKLINPCPLQNFDEGFDCYATQVVNGPHKESYAISWLSLPEIVYPTDQEDWQGCLSLVKQLHLQNGKLIQVPVTIPTSSEKFDPLHDKLRFNEVLTFDLKTLPTGTITLGNSTEQLSFQFQADQKTLTIDRQQAGQAIISDYGDTRTIALDSGAHQLKLWLDASSFELFLDGGQKVVSGRFFPTTNDWRIQTQLNISVKITGQRLQKIF
ncbi:sucrose-6-phosphate hydrolase [Lactobacillus sp. DCY120]|uniref:Sucrose-6-phosphate hydrolase n=1 Tax=Bombilactobacillus apium TaxID=2675299 RepID=A0A850QUY7_9LACO|nr:sucrose-6-phosphate hydrolase [Bombilactobacillus apium]NVY95594.1 sucrose-6-phosphate hydrolase [Bombilactobacillus apium]